MGNALIDGKAGETLLLLGNEAIARGALEAGVRFVTCYPGTPSSEVPDAFFRMYQAARDLRESYRVVNYKVKKHGIDPKRFTPGRRG